MAKPTRKTIGALAVSVVLVAVAALLTTAAVLRPQVLGFNDPARATGALADAPAATAAGRHPTPVPLRAVSSRVRGPRTHRRRTAPRRHRRRQRRRRYQRDPRLPRFRPRR